MSNFNFFVKYKNECKTLSQVVNKFDFDNFVEQLLSNNCNGNFNIFDDVLSKKTRYSFLLFCLDNVFVNGGKYDKSNMSEIKLVNLLKVIFELKDNTISQIKVRDYYDNTNKKMIWKDGFNPSLIGLKRQWLLSKLKENNAAQICSSSFEDAIIVN